MKVRIESPVFEDQNVPYSAHGTKIYFDDKELHQVGDITVKYPVRKGAVTVDFSIYPTAPLSLIENAQVNITLYVLPGYKVVTREQDDGSFVYLCGEKIE